MGVKRLIHCPKCNLPNRYGDPACVSCKAPLPKAPPLGPPRPGGGPPPPGGRGPPAGGPRKGPPPAGPRPPAQVANPRETVPMRRVDLSTTEPPAAKAAPEPETEARVGKATPTTRISADKVDRAKIVGWLCCDPLPPIPLGSKPVLTIGRHHDCDLVLPHKEVSRRHAVVKVRAGTIVLEDEGSSNGCFVNGNRMSNGVLRVGDVITLGPYEVEIKSNEAMARSEVEKSDTKTNLELTSASRLSPAAAMTGKLQDVPLAEVLQGIEFNKKSGTLVVTVDRNQQGKLVVKDGVPQTARWGDLQGDEAVLRMLTLFKGRFTFSGVAEDVPRSMRSTLTALLLEASRRIDEGDTAPTDEGSVPRPARDDPDEEEDLGDFNFG